MSYILVCIVYVIFWEILEFLFNTKSNGRSPYFSERKPGESEDPAPVVSSSNPTEPHFQITLRAETSYAEAQRDQADRHYEQILNRNYLQDSLLDNTNKRF